jgi:small subunit ribosomal protein S4
MDGLETAIFPAWLDVDKQNATATVTALPKREDIDYLVEEHYIVEWYSKKV